MLRSYWEDVKIPPAPSLKGDVEVDVAIVGGGITGVTTAYLLKQAGLRVALLEKLRCGQGGDTDRTTAHLTYVTDTWLSHLVTTFGRDRARLAWQAGQAAIEFIAQTTRSEGIACDFTWLPGYLHSRWRNADAEDETQILRDEANLANELGFAADFVAAAPVAERPAVRFANQACFHPFKYLSGILARIPGEGSFVCEHTEAQEFSASPLSVRANGHTVRCRELVIATHTPLSGLSGFAASTLLQSRLAGYNSYVVGGALPAGTVVPGLFWDSDDPYYYLRLAPQGDRVQVIFGGEDHKTGLDCASVERFERLEALLRMIAPEIELTHRWSGQVIESHDGLPYIGTTSDHQYVATGFAGNGMTFGVVSALMIRDRLTKGQSPYDELFAPGRITIRGAAWDYLKENVSYPYHFVRDRFVRPHAHNSEEVLRGQGQIVDLAGRKCAVYRDEAGHETRLDPECSHMGCLVHWNSAESTWDCPCHGSRFLATGEVLAGPAERSLAPFTGAEAATHHEK